MGMREALRGAIEARSRQSRRRQRDVAEMFDGLATLLESGLPLLESIRTLARSSAAGRQQRSMLHQLDEALRSGHSLGEAMNACPHWFSTAESAMVDCSQHSGQLDRVLRMLSERSERGEGVRQKLVAAAIYPTVVAALGLVATVFLGNVTLPELITLLQNAGGEPPALSMAVMTFGGVVADHVAGVCMLVIALLMTPMIWRTIVLMKPDWWGRLSLAPQWLNRLRFAQTCNALANMIKAGVPLAHAVRLLAPATRSASMQRFLRTAADRMEQGEDAAEALSDPRFSTPELHRLIELGQSSGRLDELLEQAARRAERQVTGMVNRFITLLEPAMILLLAAIIGLVVMASILPILRLQEVI